jgi:predicted Zn-dependent protease
VILALIGYLIPATPVMAQDATNSQVNNPAPVYESDKEVKQEIAAGQEAADEIAKDPHTKLVTDPALLQRVTRIGNEIASVARVTQVRADYGNSQLAKFDYTFHIVDDKDINAFSLPGGFIYVNKGLLDYTQSDDELAGVLAHETSHCAHHHGMQLQKMANQQMLIMAGTLLVGAVVGSNKGADVGTLAYASSLITTARMSGYGQKAEFDADRTGVNFLAHTHYNPTGLLTFMERLVRDEVREPEVIYGIYATHPPSVERAQKIIEEMEKLNLTISRRMVTSYMRVQTKPIPNSTATAVWIGEVDVVHVADANKETSAVRAQQVAAKLSDVMIADAQFRDVKVSGDEQSVVVLDRVIFEPAPEDAALMGKTIPDVCHSMAKAIQKSLLDELVNEE